MKFYLSSRIVGDQNLSRSELLLSLVFVSIISAFAFAFGTVKVTAQDEKKVIMLARTIKPPLKINGIQVGQTARTFNESFDAEAEWIRALSFKLENISGKPIVYLKININFPETRATGNLMSYAVSFGQRPGSKLKQNNSPLLLKAGESLEVLLEKEKDRLYKFVNERQPIESIKKVEMEISFIVFEDKTAWSAGSFMRQDPANPDRYNPEPPR